jgi:gluconolactonase
MTDSATSFAGSGLVEDGAQLELVTDGFSYTEGLVWDFANDQLIFHDLVGDTRYRWNARDGLIEDQRGTEWANGMVIDGDGRLLVCICGGNRIERHDPDGGRTELVSHFEGRELNSPNDIVVHSRTGDIYFSDPAYGRLPDYGIERPQELDYQGVYRIRADSGDLELLSRDFVEQPNGLCFSPDESLLYVNDTQTGHIDVFEVDDEGRLQDPRIFVASVGPAIPWQQALDNTFPGGYVDGMKCDERGNVYVTGPGGIRVFAPDGSEIGVIETPENVANFCFGDADGRSLYIGCKNSIRRLRMTVKGSPAPGFKPRR